jgi:hypothetical protein
LILQQDPTNLKLGAIFTEQISFLFGNKKNKYMMEFSRMVLLDCFLMMALYFLRLS